MPNLEKKAENGSVMPKVALVVGGIALAAGAAYASGSLFQFRGYSYPYSNCPPDSGIWDIKLKRIGSGLTDSIIIPGGIGQTDGLYWVNTQALSDTIREGDTISVETYNSNDPSQKANLAIVIDTLPMRFWLPSLIMHNTSMPSKVPWNLAGNIKDTSGTEGAVKVAFWKNSDTSACYDSVPSFRGNDQHDSLRVIGEALPNGVQDDDTVHVMLYKGDAKDPSMWRNLSFIVNRHVGRFENDVLWLKNAIVFPSQYAGIHEVKGPEIHANLGAKSPCRKADLASFLGKHPYVQAIGIDGRIHQLVGGYDDIKPGAYLLRDLCRLEHAKHEEVDLSKLTQKVVVTN